jgi:hypothetical protein
VTRRIAKPILDTTTGQEWSSESKAGKALFQLVGGNINDNFVWFKIKKAFPGRFRTKNAEGKWVGLDDPSAPMGSLRTDAKPILDTTTRKQFSSETEAGRTLYWLVDGDINDTFVWFEILRTFPDRFRTKNIDGEWVRLDDPTAPRGTTLPGS